MDSVYLVWSDNGEQWEDAFRCICGAFSTEEKAVEHIRLAGCTEKRDMGGWMVPKIPYPCDKPPCNLGDEEWCPKGEWCDRFYDYYDSQEDYSYMYVEKITIDKKSDA